MKITDDYRRTVINLDLQTLQFDDNVVLHIKWMNQDLKSMRYTENVQCEGEYETCQVFGFEGFR